MKKRLIKYLFRHIVDEVLEDGRPDSDRLERFGPFSIPLYNQRALSTEVSVSSWRAKLALLLGARFKVRVVIGSLETLPPIAWRTEIEVK
jgi:hypothetical protein